VSLVVLFSMWVGAQVGDLGADSFDVREAATERLDNPLCALFLPHSSEDPEVNYRLHLLRRRNLKWLSPEYCERVLYRHDFAWWLDAYFCPGKNRVCDADAYADLERDLARRCALDERWSMPKDPWIPIPELPREYEFAAWCDFHRCRAPAPREVQK
jgi:hypothetical protein